MTDTEIIAYMAKEIVELKQKMRIYREAMVNIENILYRVDGPLNSDIDNYTSKQLQDFIDIKNEVVIFSNDK